MKRLTALLFICLWFIVGCQPSSAPTQSQALAVPAISSAAINHSYFIVGTLNQGAVVYSKDTQTPTYHWHMGPSESPIETIAIAGNAPLAITTSGSNLVIWDLSSGKALHFLTAPSTINDVAINSDGSVAALALTNHQATIIDLKRGGIVNTFEHSNEVLAVALNEKRWLLTGDEANTATLWSFNKKAVKQQTHQDGVNQVGFSPDAATALTSSRYDSIHLWQSDGGFATIEKISTKARNLNAGKRLVDFTFLDNKTLLLGYSDRQIELRVVGSNAPTNTWNLSKKTALTRDSTALIAVGEFKNKYYAITSNGLLHQLLSKP